MLMYADYDSLIQEDVKFRQPETQEPIIMENVGATNVITSVVKMEQDEPVDDEEDDEFFEMHDSGSFFLFVDIRWVPMSLSVP